MSILSKAILEALNTSLRKWANARITSYVVSKYSIVVLERFWCGIAFTPLGEKPVEALPETLSLRYLARIAGKSSVERSLAVAGLNAATSMWLYYTYRPRGVYFEPCLLDLAGVKKGEKVVLAGFMKPLAEKIRKRGARLVVLEDSETLAREASLLGYTVSKNSERELREADHVFISGSSVVIDPHRTREELKTASHAKTRALVGPSSSFHPLVAKRLEATMVAGSLVPLGACRKAFHLVSAGHGYHSLTKRIRIVKWAAIVSEAF